MKQHVIIVLLLLFSILTFGQSFQNFITLDGKQFKDGSNDFYPIAVNYSIAIYEKSNVQFISSHLQHTETNNITCLNAQDGLDEINEDLRDIAAMGFNSVRLFGLRFGKLCNNVGCTEYTSGNAQVIYNLNSSGNFANTYIEDNYDINEMIFFLKQFLDLAEANGLRVIYLTQGDFIFPLPSCTTNCAEINSAYIDYLQTLAVSSNIVNHKALLAYDLFNEPLYFFNDFQSYNNKTGYCEIVKDWKSALTSDENHLTTIGLISSNEVFKFDPNLMDVDFISLHNYNEGGTQNTLLRNIKWFSKFSEKPWIIGETSYSAKAIDGSSPLVDDSSYPYDEGSIIDQKDYFVETFDLCHDCQGSGYSWWLHKDVPWFSDANQSSYLNYYGMQTRVNKQDKPIVDELNNRRLTETLATSLNNCILSDNIYYDVLNSSTYPYTFSGTIVDENDIPIEGAVVRGVYHVGTDLHSHTTFTNENGYFTLYAQSPVELIDFSATIAEYRWIGSPNNFNGNNKIFQYPSKLNWTVNGITSSRPVSYKAKNDLIFNNFTHSGYIGYAKAGHQIDFNPGTTIEETFTAYIVDYDYICPILVNPTYNRYSNGDSSGFSANHQEEGEISLSTISTSNILEFDFELFPNPIRNELKISVPNTLVSYQVEVISITGQPMFKGDNTSKINTTLFARGIYFVKVWNDQHVVIKKVIKE